MGEDVIGVEANTKNENGDKKPGDCGEEKYKKESLQATRERVCTPLF